MVKHNSLHSESKDILWPLGIQEKYVHSEAYLGFCLVGVDMYLYLILTSSKLSQTIITY